MSPHLSLTRETLDLYRLTPELLHALYLAQGGRCGICDASLVDPVIDHDHACCPGKRTCGRCVRGLLCRACNLDLAVVERRWHQLWRIWRYSSRRPMRGSR